MYMDLKSVRLNEWSQAQKCAESRYPCNFPKLRGQCSIFTYPQRIIIWCLYSEIFFHIKKESFSLNYVENVYHVCLFNSIKLFFLNPLWKICLNRFLNIKPNSLTWNKSCLQFRLASCFYIASVIMIYSNASRIWDGL